MSKKVLLIESSLAVRNIAESLLRQNSYEAISAENSQTAREILQTSRIDLILVASDITDLDGKIFYEAMGADASTATLPLLILHDPTAGDLAYPPEAIINKPFTPREFLDKVNAFTGGKTTPISENVAPIAESTVEDELIDQALGLDKLQVDEAEVLGNDTGAFRILNKQITKETMLGFEYDIKEDTSVTKKKKPQIDEVNIPADKKAETKQEDVKSEFLGHDSKQLKISKKDGLTESGKIEIVTDQYGMTDPQQFEAVKDSAGGESHDYHWFINEMQKESVEEAPADSGSLKIESPSQNMDPVAPVSPDVRTKQSPPAVKTSSQETQNHGQAVDKFISEFKKEMEKISEDADQALPDIPVTQISPEKQSPDKAATPLDWEEAIERVTPSEIRSISGELVNAIAGKIAEEILARIDPDMIYRILRECISEALEKNLKK